MLGFRDREPDGSPARVLFVIPSFSTWGAATGRNSIQFRQGLLDEAEAVGVSAQIKRVGRLRDRWGVVLAIVPALFPFFCTELAQLFANSEVWTQEKVGAVVQSAQRYLGAVAANAGTTDREPTSRPTILRQILQPIRERRFAEDVLEAYGYRCAICSMDLGLLDAAHIDPVDNDGSSDDVTIGIALCPNHHRAYDRGLIDILQDGRVNINRTKLDLLIEDARASALELFRSGLPSRIRFPMDSRERPSPESFIRRRNYLSRSK